MTKIRQKSFLRIKAVFSRNMTQKDLPIFLVTHKYYLKNIDGIQKSLNKKRKNGSTVSKFQMGWLVPNNWVHREIVVHIFINMIDLGKLALQMQAALKRGLEYGILMKNNGHYFLNTEDEPQLTSNLAPSERYRRQRRRRRSKRRRRRRSRGRKRRRTRRSRRLRRRRSRRRSRPTRGRRIGCTRCRCTKRSRDVHVLRNSPVEQQVPDDDVCTCEKEINVERRSRKSKSRDRSMSRSRSSANSDRDGAIGDRRSIHDQD